MIKTVNLEVVLNHPFNNRRQKSSKRLKIILPHFQFSILTIQLFLYLCNLKSFFEDK